MATSPINTVPRGLQSLLRNQTLGVNPNLLQQEIRPTLDLTPFLLGDGLLQTFQLTGTGVSAKGTVDGPIVPAGKLWLIYCVNSRATKVSGGNAINFSPVLINLPGDPNFFIEIRTDFFQASVANAGDEMSMSTGWLGSPIVLRAPARISTRIHSIAGTFNVTTNAVGYELGV